MTDEDKKLILRDLCGRLPYKPILEGLGSSSVELDSDWLHFMFTHIDDVRRPYLRPMSSITKEERKQLEHIFSDEDWPCWVDEDGCVNFARGNDFVCPEVFEIYFDFLNAHHLDHRDLIEKGLALEAPEGMYK